jgi:hypothetical protein
MELSETGCWCPAVSASMSRPCWLVRVELVLPAAMTRPPGPTAGVKPGPLDVLPSDPVGSHFVPVPVLV